MGFERCVDCDAVLVDEPPAIVASSSVPEVLERAKVFVSGRRMDAELIRARLEGDGIAAVIWSGGLGVYRLESALTEVTGVPNDFNFHQVMVAMPDLDRAREILEDAGDITLTEHDPYPVSLSFLRKRGLLVGMALVLLWFAWGGI
jgi:hypothetical protein